MTAGILILRFAAYVGLQVFTIFSVFRILDWLEAGYDKFVSAVKVKRAAHIKKMKRRMLIKKLKFWTR